MKKIFVMLCMMTIALPVAAQEVKLKCNFSNGEVQIWGFDEANGYVIDGRKDWGWQEENIRTGENKFSIKIEHENGNGVKTLYFITPNEFGLRSISEDKTTRSVNISRMDGEITRGGELEYDYSRPKKGSCVLFKQAF